MENWPMAAGPKANWTTTTNHRVPISWSVSTNKNIKWKTILPEGGQSGIAVWNNKLFLTINKPLPKGTPVEEALGNDIVGYCINANSGEIEWSVTIPSTRRIEYSGLFSDKTSPTPITDGNYVWFINTGGLMVCYDMQGKLIWNRSFESRSRHAAKQCEPILVDGQILYVMVLDEDDPKRKIVKLPEGSDKKMVPNSDKWPWTYVRSFDAYTGEPLWSESIGTSVHNTPAIGNVDGDMMIYHIRGGGHQPPETPYGFSMSYASGEKAGQQLWSHVVEKPFAYTMSNFNESFAYGIGDGSLLEFNSKKGELLKEIPLFKSVTIHKWDSLAHKYQKLVNVPFDMVTKKYKPIPTNNSTILVGKYFLFITHEGHCIGRVDTETGKVEYIQVPVQVIREEGKKDLMLWDKHIPSDAVNSRGIKTSTDKRAKRDGWGHVTNGSPISVNEYVFFSTMLGMTYVVDSQSENFDEFALISINDLGPAGETWSLSTPSYANGRIYHRGLKYIVCIENEEKEYN